MLLIKVMGLRSTLNPCDPQGTQDSLRGQLESSLHQKILLIKVDGYDSLIINIPLIDGFSHSVLSRELQVEAR